MYVLCVWCTVCVVYYVYVWCTVCVWCTLCVCGVLCVWCTVCVVYSVCTIHSSTPIQMNKFSPIMSLIPTYKDIFIHML